MRSVGTNRSDRSRQTRLLVGILAHTAAASIADQVRAFQQYVPGCTIIVFNGGRNADLLSSIDAIPCRYSTPIMWGRGLELFQLGVARQAHEDDLDYDCLLSVDSDMVIIRDGLEAYLSDMMAGYDYMAAHLRRPMPIKSHLWTYRLTLQTRLWRDILGPPPYRAAYNPGQVLSRRLTEALFDSPTLYGRLLGELRRTRLNCLEELLWPALAAHFDLAARSYPEAQEWALGRQHNVSSVAASLRRDDVFLLHKVPLDMRSEERRLIEAVRVGEPIASILGGVAEQQPAPLPVVDDSEMPARVRLGNVRLRAEAIAWSLAPRPEEKDLSTVIRRRRYAGADGPHRRPDEMPATG